MISNTNHRTPSVPFVQRALWWTCVLATVLATPAGRGATDAANVAALQSNLPANVTLQQAGTKQIAAALHETILQHYNDALDILRVAILARTSRQDEGDFACVELRRLVQAACTGAPDRASKLVELASALHPGCADSLQDLLTTVGDDAPRAEGDDVIRFGVGFGPGLPGAPSFVGPTANGSAVGPLPVPSPSPFTPTAND